MKFLDNFRDNSVSEGFTFFLDHFRDNSVQKRHVYFLDHFRDNSFFQRMFFYTIQSQLVLIDTKGLLDAKVRNDTCPSPKLFSTKNLAKK